MEEHHFSNRQLETPPASPLPEGVEEAFGSEQEEFEQEEVEYEQHACEQEEYEEEGYQGEEEDDRTTAYEEEYEEGEEEEGLYNWGDDLELTLPALYYHNHAPCRDFSDEPVWNQTEPIPMPVEEQEEDRRWMEYHQKNLQDMDRKMEDKLMHYVALAEKQPRYPQEPLRVSMVHVDSGHPSTSQPGGHGEVNSSSGSQNLPPSAYISDSEKPFPWSDDEVEAEESAEEQGRAMSSIERSLRAQAVTALHNPSAMLLHSVSMNEPQPPHEYAPESVKQAYGESGGKPLDDHSHHLHHHYTDTHASSSSSSSHTAAASEHYQHHNHHSHGHHHHHHHMDSSSSHVDDDVPMDDEFGPTYFQGALND
ncbi:hypothetical protein KI688_000170 [Linnemannia hyalina]|uniref:Uncharacterized protein n=1 Tax=Linnemannia hyalina TaxID=64524 RepID=A0A9P8BXV6_9FUNG|nr:hypothetical protein KI688_000170 [Linnemannia hyalina]